MPEWTANESTINDSDVNGQRQRTVGFDLPEGETSYIDVSHSRAAGSKDFPARSDSHYFREDEANRAAFLERAKDWNSAWEEQELERAWENEIVRRTWVRSDTQLYRDDEEGHKAFMERMKRLARGEEERGKDAPEQTKSYWGAGSQYDDVLLDRSTQMPQHMTQETPMLTKTDTQLFRTDEEKHKAFLERTGQIEDEKEVAISSTTGGKAESTSRSSPHDARKPRRTDTFMHRQDETSHTAFVARMEADLAIPTTISTVPAKVKNQSTRNATQKKESSVDPDALLFSPVRPPSRKSRVLMCIEKEWLCCEEEVLNELTSLEHKEGEIVTWARHGVRQCDMWAEEVCACGI